jgi:DNA-binding CsgD family transcriptional regulator
MRRMHETLQPVHQGHLFSTEEWHEHLLYECSVGPFNFEHYLVAPLMDSSGIVGALAFARRELAHAFTEKELTAVAMTTTYASVAMAYSKRCQTSALEIMSSLTERESLISTLVAKGLCNYEIAEQMQISENTVKKHLKLMFARLGVSRRAELAWLATLAGLA